MSGRKWRLDRRAELHWRCLDDEWVVFEAASGDTHHLDTIAAAVLMCLEADPLDLDGLSEVIASELQVPNRDDLAGRLDDLLAQLQGLGLVEPAQP
jgi:PqqD family protein of HPr-rel-A system